MDGFRRFLDLCLRQRDSGSNIRFSAFRSVTYSVIHSGSNICFSD
jgi:hypothetical protein